MNFKIIKQTNAEQTIQDDVDKISQYYLQVHTYFKQQFSESLCRGKIIEFENLINATLLELGFSAQDQQDLEFFRTWYEQIVNLAYIQQFVQQLDINEIILHGPNSIQLDLGGKLVSSNLADFTLEDYQLSLEVLAIKNRATWNFATPFASFFVLLCGHQFRASLIHQSTSPKQMSKLYLRRIAHRPFGLSDYKIQSSVQCILKQAIDTKQNIIITGPAGSGKTSMLSTLLGHIDKREHIIILEDTHEIQSDSKSHTFLLANSKLENKGLKDYCAYALRMRPDRILLGEMRSSEIVPFILAMNNGHKGLMSTIHANSASDAISRLALLFSIYAQGHNISYETIIKLICINIDIIIYMTNKQVFEMIRVLGSEGKHPYFEYIINKGAYEITSN